MEEQDKIKLQKALIKCGNIIHMLNYIIGLLVIGMTLSILILIWFSCVLLLKILITGVILIIILAFISSLYKKIEFKIQKMLINSLKYKSPKSGGFMGRLEEAIKNKKN